MTQTHFCACGCGAIVPNTWHIGHNRKDCHTATEFKKGHHGRTEWKDGDHISPKTEWKEGHRNSPEAEVRRAAHYSITRTGHEVTRPTRQKLSRAAKGKHLSPASEWEKGHEPWNRGMHEFRSPEGRERQRIAVINSRGTYQRDTSIELAVQNALRKAGLKFETDYPISDITRADIAFPTLQIAIFCDGDYWHRDTYRRDMRQSLTLGMMGWIPLRFWEHEINKDLPKVMTEILQIIKLRIEDPVRRFTGHG